MITNYRLIISDAKSPNNNANLSILTDDLISKILQNNKYTKSNIIRYYYYSQIKQDDNIYTEEYKVLDTPKIIKDYKVYYMSYTTEKQDNCSFPNLHKYHHTCDIIQYVIDKKDYKIIIENNKLIIEFNKMINVNDISSYIKLIL